MDMSAAAAATGTWTDPDGIRTPAVEVHAWHPGTNQSLCGLSGALAGPASGHDEAPVGWCRPGPRGPYSVPMRDALVEGQTVAGIFSIAGASTPSTR